jgi:solute carrier family 12 sodium/potassium/chloride transporter 2
MDRFTEMNHHSNDHLSCPNNGEEEQHSGNWMEMKEESLNSSQEGMQTNSRFRVAPVDVEVSRPRDIPGRRSADAMSHNDEQFSSPVGSYTGNRTLSNSYDTKNLKSLRHYTRDALPRADHYRNILSVHGYMSRPTMDELHGGQHTVIIEAVSFLGFAYF